MRKRQVSKAGRKRAPKSTARKRAPKRTARKRVSKPLVFISHKHKDKPIADVISKFLKAKSGGRVEIFQSSGFIDQGPEIGKNLNQELMRYLWTASAVILVYTGPDQDWSYCMWECGVAMDPKSPDTKIIVFQCAGQSPALFNEQVRVDIRNTGLIQRFTNDFLTNAQFFPRYGRALAKFKENDQQVFDAAQELFDRLQEVAPPMEDPPIEEWPAFPFLRLDLSTTDVDSICDAPPRRRERVARDLIKRHCLIGEGDKEAGQLFGVPTITPGTPFQKLIEKWVKKNARSKSKWIDALFGQIIDGAQWDFPRLAWELMPGFDSKTMYAPMLTRVRKIPKLGMQFDIYFYKFSLGTSKGKQLFLGPRRRS